MQGENKVDKGSREQSIIQAAYTVCLDRLVLKSPVVSWAAGVFSAAVAGIKGVAKMMNPASTLGQSPSLAKIESSINPESPNNERLMGAQNRGGSVADIASALSPEQSRGSYSPPKLEDISLEDVRAAPVAQSRQGIIKVGAETLKDADASEEVEPVPGRGSPGPR